MGNIFQSFWHPLANTIYYFSVGALFKVPSKQEKVMIDEMVRDDLDPRYDQYAHFPYFDHKKSASRCETCKKTTH